MKLNDISDNQGARKERTRVGRGIGSGKGKTAGRGHKGHGARSGGPKLGFEGGQMPIYRRLPKRGFNKPNQLSFNEVNLSRLQAAVDAGKLDPKQPVDLSALIAAGVPAELHLFAEQPHGFDADARFSRLCAETMSLFIERYVIERAPAPAVR